MIRNKEIFQRSFGNIEIGSMCFGFGMPMCNLVMNQLFGRRSNQRNEVSHRLTFFLVNEYFFQDFTIFHFFSSSQ